MKKIIKTILEYGKSILVALILVFICINFLFAPIRVVGKSMDTTLADGDYGLSFIITKTVFGINRFDIVTLVVDNHEDRLVKRIIGLPNDHLVYKNNKLYIDDVYIKEDFLNSNQITEDFDLVLKDDEYFVMGDNRLNSLDSRSFGPVNSGDIKTSGIFVLFPFDNFGLK